MKFTLGFTFDIDPEAWASEYDLDGSTAAVADITGTLTTHALDGSLAKALVGQWGMMRDQATLTVTPPGAVLAGMDWSDTLAAAEVAKLSPQQREELLHAITAWS